MDIKELREKAKEAGIDKWHVKSEERLLAELTDPDTTPKQPVQASENNPAPTEGRQVKAYFTSGYTCYCSELGLEKVKEQMADFTHYEVV